MYNIPNKKSKHELRKVILRTNDLLLIIEDVTLLLMAANTETDSLIIIINEKTIFVYKIGLISDTVPKVQRS